MAATPSSMTDSSSGTPVDSVSTSSKNSAAEKQPDDSSRLKILLGILRKFIGVADIAAVRFSLPAQLLEPIPNLEYWNYLDRPETFVSIGDSDDPLERMLAVLRFWFTKDLKYVKGKPCKPYNSSLGEFFRCKWEVQDPAPPILASTSSNASSSTSVPSSENGTTKRPVTITYLTEQTSHHPPVSAFFVDCPEKGINARGYDQLSAKFTGTSVRVTPGMHNLGIFITLQNRDNEEYQLTHPTAHLGGLLRGSPSVSVSDVCTIVCPKTNLKTILNYIEEGWLGRAQNKVHGVIFRYDPSNDKTNKIKDVPETDILAIIEGCWQDKIYFAFPGSSDRHLLIDLTPLFPVPKIVPPEEDQLPNESRRFWHDVTQAIHAKEWSKATTLKQRLEEGQREKAAQRKSEAHEWRPRFFTGVVTPIGKPELSTEGEAVLKGLERGEYRLEESAVRGA
ncbi:MAG: hypothetical protein M1823_001543 [Watsoniomyces obsoletus]|nr:MAG: hypothetical protein M1823_001543 [Watsoniomyces obsoletus]